MPSVMLRVADAMRTSGYLPEDKAEQGKAVKSRLSAILSSPSIEPLGPKPIPRVSVHMTVWLSAVQVAIVERLGQADGMSVGEAATALLLRDFDAWVTAQAKPEPTPETTPKGSLNKALRAKKLTIRDEQVRVQQELRRLTAVEGGPKVLFCEAGTGTGKTLAYLGHAIDCIAEHPDWRIMVAAPTFGLLQQIRSDLALFGKAAPEAVFLAGQTEWVSESALRELLTHGDLDDDHAVLVSAWLKRGGKDAANAWTVASLIDAVPGFRFADDVTVRSRADDEDRGWLAYQGQFERAAQASLIVATHAMLAHLVKYRLLRQLRAAKGDESIHEAAQDWLSTTKDLRGVAFHEAMNAALDALDLDDGCDRLPNIDLLIVDEGHAIEDAFANAFGTYASLRSLADDARELQKDFPGFAHAQSPQALTDLISKLQALGKSAGADEVMALEQRAGLLDELLAAIQSAIKPKTSAKAAVKREAQASKGYQRLWNMTRALEVASAAILKGSSSLAAYLHWSPARDYPRVTVGKLRLDRELHYLWTVVTQRTALVSGTLYEEIPRPSCESIRRALAVPPQCVMEMAPIHARWQIDPVEMCVVPLMRRLNGEYRFVRPKAGQDRERHGPDWQHWIADLASYSRQVMETSAGGVLVLGTAFADLEALQQAIGQVGHGWHMLIQRPGMKLAGLRQEFLTRSQSGKVILLATGAAWTGFDLYDKDSQNHDLCTDLVMLNAPFGLRQSSVSSLRRQAAKTGHFEIAAHTLVLVRQAIGRLVRSPDTPHNRRIHWLDARIHLPELVGMLSSTKRFMTKYRITATG